ncbi:MAG: FHA domain-containing protein [Oscillospiraceae bacterium]|nr:FHA domain-containing protein [Oscillospiraceae bacterium]
MMKFTFENQGTSTFLVYEVAPEDELDSMGLGMLTNNKIDGFAPASFMQIDSTRYIKYNVSAKVSAAQLLSGTVNKKRLLGVFSGVIKAILSAEDYMLDVSSLVLDLDYIFTDVSTCETVLVSLPVLNRAEENPELLTFFKNIIFNAQFDQTENCGHVAQILNHLNSTPTLAPVEFQELLDKLADQAEPAVKAQSAAAELPSKPVQPEAKPASPDPKPKVQATPTPEQPKNPTPNKLPSTPEKYKNLQFGSNYPSGGQKDVSDKGNKPAEAESEEKEISMFYLLQHYNKENAALYKAQKEAKKAKKKGMDAPNANYATPVKQPEAPAGYPVPGKQPAAPGSYPMPGKQPAAPGGYPVPGKQPAAPGGYSMPGKQPAAPGGYPVPGKQPAAPGGYPMPGKQPAVPGGYPMPGKQPAVPGGYEQPAQKPVEYPPYQPQPATPAKPISFGSTVVMGAPIGPTTVLIDAPVQEKSEAYLIRQSTQEKTLVNKALFRIGKEQSYVDYCISNNSAISRSHATILKKGEDYFIVDTNSTNHTYVNGKMIQSNVETRLSHGDTVRLANEDFEFGLY